MNSLSIIYEYTNKLYVHVSAIHIAQKPLFYMYQFTMHYYSNKTHTKFKWNIKGLHYTTPMMG